MKILFFCFVAAVQCAAQTVVEGKRLPLLFSYQPVYVVPPKLSESKPAFKAKPADFRKSDFEKPTGRMWVDESPIVAWGAGIRKGLIVVETGRGNITFLSSKRRILGYNRRW